MKTGKKKRSKRNAVRPTASPEVDEFEVTRRKITTMEQSAAVFIDELRGLPLWQQRAIVDEVHELVVHGLRYIRIVIAGIQRSRASTSRAKPNQKHAANAEFAKRFVEVWTQRTPNSNGQPKSGDPI